MKYFAYVKEDGGCDYTIACGRMLFELKAKTMDEAKVEVATQDGEDAEFQIQDLTGLLILEVSDTFLPDLAALKKAVAKRRMVEEDAKEKAKRQKDYERLKKEFEGK